ncbi:MAG TPA: cbb3-type cytochrome oxidase assembly protein CcoS [Bacteroidetes bacterium]|nr:cbb3-type cytochrome oxidase assembly protein CcoS [Bacteroidota bacterium]
MNIIFVLIIVSLIVALGFLAAFIWAVKSGQYEDDYTPSVRMLFDDKPSVGPQSKAAAPGVSGQAARSPRPSPLPNLKK